MICPFFDLPKYFIFSSDVPILLYYSHIPSIVVALFVGIFVFLKGRHFLLNKLLLAISVFFSMWAIISLITWTNINSDEILFVWSLLGLIFAIIAILSIYFIYVFLDRKDVGVRVKVIFLILLTPVFLLSSTSYNLGGFDLKECDAFKLENVLFQAYYISLGIMAMIWIFVLLFKNYRTATPTIRKEIILIGLGLESFLFLFFGLSFVASYLTTIGFLSDSRLEMYGLFGMTFFISLLSYVIVKFKVFNIKLIGAQALVWALVIFIGSQFLYMDKMPLSSLIITAITLVLSAVIGLMIVRGIKKEIAIRERIETLADELEHTNERLRVLDQQKTQFVSLASHQLRAPLTAIKGYLSMILEGDYGPVEGEVKEMIQRVETSANNLVTIVGDFLDVSRIEQGKMNYEWADFDVKPLVKTVEHELQSVADKRGLVLTLNVENGTEFKIHGDMNKLKQVFTNLVDNSIKYTPKGEVKITLSRPMPKIVRFEIKDTGIGISPESLPKLFEKFVRADGANDVNVIGTGLGLFVAKEMIKAHDGGKIWAESEGLGKGSRFVVELKAL